MKEAVSAASEDDIFRVGAERIYKLRLDWYLSSKSAVFFVCTLYFSWLLLFFCRPYWETDWWSQGARPWEILSHFLLNGCLPCIKPKQNHNDNGQRVRRTAQLSHLPVHRASARQTSIFYWVLLSVAQVVSFQNVPQSPIETLWSWRKFPGQLPKSSLSYFIPVPSNCILWQYFFSFGISLLQIIYRKMLSVPLITHHPNSR